MITEIIHDSRRVDEWTSGQVNELFAKKDRIIERQSNKWTKFFWVTSLRVDKQLVNLSTCPLKHVHLLLCLLFTLSTSNLLTCPLVHSSTRPLKTCSFVTLSFIYPVYKQLVRLSTRSLCHFKNCSRGVSMIDITRESFTLRCSSFEARRSLSALYKALTFSGPSINLMA